LSDTPFASYLFPILMGQSLQAPNTILDRRMAGEHAVGTGFELLDRVGNIEVSRTAIGGPQFAGVLINLAQGMSQAKRIARQFDAGRIRQVFALAADGQLDDLG